MANIPVVKSSKKLAKILRKQARAANAEYQKAYAERLSQKLAIFEKLLKPRPRWVPKRVWFWFGHLFIDLEALGRELTFRESSVSPVANVGINKF